MPNYPNPFNPSTTIQYCVGSGVRDADAGWVRLAVYDLLGREVAVLVNDRKEPGNHSVQWDATGMSSGVYLCRFKAGSFVETRAMLLLR